MPDSGVEKGSARRGYAWIAIGIAVIVAVALNHREPATATPERPAAKTDPRAVSALAGALALRKSMRDPDSFKLISVRLMPGAARCYQFRSRNGFGGMDEQYAVLTDVDLHLQAQAGFAELWNKHCVGIGEDVTAYVEALLGAP